MTQLEGSENRISVERRNYIQAVETYNQQISKFPDKIIAKLLGFEKKTNYVATEQGKKYHKWNLNKKKIWVKRKK